MHFKKNIIIGILVIALSHSKNIIANSLTVCEIKEYNDELQNIYFTDALGFEAFYNKTIRILQEKKENEKKARLKEQLEFERKNSVTFNCYNVREISNLTTDELYSILPDSMKHLASIIITSENDFSINAFFIAGLICQESGFLTSSRSTNSNNVAGMGVYTSSSVGYTYSSQEECVYDTVRQLDKYYLTEGAMYFYGYTLWDINEKYCIDTTYKGHWADSINKISNNFLTLYREHFL